MIYIIYGANGIGKKTVRDHIHKKYGLKILDKYTNGYDDYEEKDGKRRLNRDRGLRLVLKEDGTEMSNNEFKKVCPQDEVFYYLRKKHDNSEVYYAIKKAELREAANDNKNDYLLVLSSYEIIKKIRTLIDNDHAVKVIFIAGDTHHTHLDLDDQKRWADEEIISTNEMFNRTVSKFEGVILNKVDSQTSIIEQKIEQQWENITKMQSLEVRNTAFIVRPFSKENIYNEEVHKYIETRLKKEGINKVNIVQPESEKPIITSIIQQISSAGLIIVDLSGNKNNCYYELAYARALGKKVITIIRESDVSDIAFDTEGFPYFVYRINKKTVLDETTHEPDFLSPIYKQNTWIDEVREYCRINHIFVEKDR